MEPENTMLSLRRNIAGKRFTEAGSILKELYRQKEIPVMEAEVCSDRIHMLPEIPPERSVSSIIDYLKGKSGLLIYE